MSEFENRVVIVTGGARGIGRATVEAFAAQGAVTVIWDVDAETGAASAQAVRAAGGQCRYRKVDVASPESVREAVEQVLEQHQRIDVLVNNAGITRDARLVKMTAEEWRQVIEVNLTGVFNCTQAVALHMIEKGYGRILNASSVVGIYGNFGQSNYVASKAGVIGMTKVWARELGPKGITVNAVAPGFIATDMVDTIPEKIIDMMTTNTPVQRMGQPEDIANAYLFLSGERAGFINGAVLSVDGGLTI